MLRVDIFNSAYLKDANGGIDITLIWRLNIEVVILCSDQPFKGSTMPFCRHDT